MRTAIRVTAAAAIAAATTAAAAAIAATPAFASVSSPAAATATARADGDHAVFVQTDNTAGNRVVAYQRAADGTLIPAGSYATGGRGATGADSRRTWRAARTAPSTWPRCARPSSSPGRLPPRT